MGLVLFPGNGGDEPGHARHDEEGHQPSDPADEGDGGDNRPLELAKPFPSLGRPVPGRVGHEGRQDDRADPFGDEEPEQALQRRDQDHEHEQLSDLDADVEGQEGCHEVRARELERLAQGERKPEPVHEAEREREEPSPLDAHHAHDVFERHIEDRDRDERIDQRRKPESTGRVIEG